MDKDVTVLYNEIDWLEKVINQVVSSYLMHEGHEESWTDIPLPDLSDMSDTYYGAFVNERELNCFDRLALALTMAVHIKPNVLDVFFGENKTYDRHFTEFGGAINNSHSGFLPTGQTYLFLMTASTPKLRAEAMNVLEKSNILFKEQVLVLESVEEYIPVTSAALYMSNMWVKYFMSGKPLEAEYSTGLPAKKITTALEWRDLVLDRNVLDQLNELKTWLAHGDVLMEDWALNKFLKPGYRSLFYGPRGTGKT